MRISDWSSDVCSADLVLEGQSIAIFPPGTDDAGRAYHARQYSIASPRDGERPRYNNLSLTVKRVDVDYDGKPTRGVCSNYLCDLKKNDTVRVIGPFGNTFLMPDHQERSEEHTSELQSLMRISYAVFCLKK